MKISFNTVGLVTLMSMVKSSAGSGYCAEQRFPTGGLTGSGNGDPDSGIVGGSVAISFSNDELESDSVQVTCSITCENDAYFGDVRLKAGNKDNYIAQFDCLSSRPVTITAVPVVEAGGKFPPTLQFFGTNSGPVALTCTCSDNNARGGGCFSPATTVQVKGQGEVSLGDLNVGSEILTDAATQKYETVYAMAHKDLDTPTDFLQLFMDNTKNPLEVTADHFMYKQGQSSPVRADSLETGDIMEGGLELTKIGQVTLKGRVTPLTSSGKVVVNGQVQASNYIDYEHGTTLFGTDFTNAMSHLFISPFRLLCTANPSSDSCVKTNEEGIPAGLSFMKGYADSAMASNMFVQGSMLAAFAFAAISAWGIECLLMVPFVAWVAAMAFVANKAGVSIKKQKTV